MINVDVALDRLEDLIDLAASARSGFEKAAVFAAVASLADFMIREGERLEMPLAPQIELIRWGIFGSIGYDIRSGETPAQSRDMATEALRILRMRLQK